MTHISVMPSLHRYGDNFNCLFGLTLAKYIFIYFMKTIVGFIHNVCRYHLTFLFWNKILAATLIVNATNVLTTYYDLNFEGVLNPCVSV